MDWIERVKTKLRSGHRFVVVVTEDIVRIQQLRNAMREMNSELHTSMTEPIELVPLLADSIQENALIFSHGNYDGAEFENVVRKVYHIYKSTYVCAVVPTANVVPEHLRGFVEFVEPPISTAKERYDVMLKAIKESGANVKLTDEMVRLSKGLNLEEVYNATRESILTKGEIDPMVFRDYKIEQLRKYGLDYVEPQITFEHVGGMNYLKDYIRQRVEIYFKRPDIADMFGLKAPRGILLAGVGGTGKTWFTTALAGELSLPVVKMNVVDILERGAGMGEVQLRKLLNIIDTLSPVILFIDEIDQIALKRELIKETTRRGLVNVLMEWLGDARREVFVVGATNLIHQIDVNFLRTGRFDAIFYVPPPDEESRVEILKVHAFKLRKLKGVKMNEEILKKIAKKTELWVASDLESLVQKAYENAMVRYLADGENAEVTESDFLNAMKNVMPNMELRKAELKATISGMKMLPQGAVVKDTVEMAEIMVNIGKKRKMERMRGD